jgi:transcriptional regulator with XRE-family HTH domain
VNGGERVTEDAATRTARRQWLGRTLRKLRNDAGLTQVAAAEGLNCGQAKINKIEKTLCRIDMDQLEVLIEMYGAAPDLAARLREEATRDLENGPPRTKGNAYTELTDRELEAREIWCWHSERIPGPLKSQMYALKQQGPTPSEGKETQVLRRHKARKQVLTKADPPRYRVILSESSLHRLPGGCTPEMVQDQVSYLLDLMAKHPQLELRILPFEADVPYVDPDFQLLMFDDPELSFVYVEDSAGPRKSEKEPELKRFRDHWVALDAAALDVPATKEFLTKLLS